MFTKPETQMMLKHTESSSLHSQSEICKSKLNWDSIFCPLGKQKQPESSLCQGARETGFPTWGWGGHWHCLWGAMCAWNSGGCKHSAHSTRPNMHGLCGQEELAVNLYDRLKHQGCGTHRPGTRERWPWPGPLHEGHYGDQQGNLHGAQEEQMAGRGLR